MEASPERVSAGALIPSRLDLPTGDPLVGELFPSLAAGGEWKLDRMYALLEAIGGSGIECNSRIIPFGLV